MTQDIVPNQPISEASEHAVRLDKVRRLQEMGIDPWPAAYPAVQHTAQQVLDAYDAAATSQPTCTIAGRIVSSRLHGKTAFAHLLDRTGKIQLYFKKDTLGEEKFSLLQHMIDIGDVLWITGSPFTTKTGETTLDVQDFLLLSKCLYPLPEKFHGLTDIEVKYRQRYLDLISSNESREKFRKRAKIISTIRGYLDAQDFIEVETPMLHPIPGGAAARPFITHHNAFDADFYLRIATELYLKRLIVGNMERVYELNRIFRNEGVSTRHNPEFTMIEWNVAYQEYHQAMDTVEDLLRTIAQQVNGSLQVQYGDHTIDFSKPFARVSPKQALVNAGVVTEADLAPSAIDATARKHNVELPAQASDQIKIFTLFEHLAEKSIVQPTFIVGFPVEISPLAKCDAKDPSIAARFELYIAGMEISNGFNELNNPMDQAARFQDQVKERAGGNSEAMLFDQDYVHALEYALPPNVGVGIGIDRLAMLMTNTTSIKDVILFPTLKHKAPEAA
jgi:lysyl-tRNA synthetase, class II